MIDEINEYTDLPNKLFELREELKEHKKNQDIFKYNITMIKLKYSLELLKTIQEFKVDSVTTPVRTIEKISDDNYHLKLALKHIMDSDCESESINYANYFKKVAEQTLIDIGEIKI